MNEPRTNADPSDANADRLAPLPGEAGIPNVAEPRRILVSRKGLLAICMVVCFVAVAAVLSIQHTFAGFRKADSTETRPVSERPTAATTAPRRIDTASIDAKAASSPAGTAAPRIPALLPIEEDLREPIGVVRTEQSGLSSGGGRASLPEDAPVMLVTTQPSRPVEPPNMATQRAEAVGGDPAADAARDLQAYQRQLRELLDSLTRSTALATNQEPGSALLGVPANASREQAVTTGQGATRSAELFGGQLQASGTARATARMIGNRSLTLPKGTAFTCALKTKIISAASGLVGCQVQRNVYSEDGRVLLIERGSHLDGEYRISSVRPGTVRIPVLWTRVRTPLGVTVDLDSPGTGKLGESGVDGYVDNRWGERIGAAMLLSLIDDSVKLVIQHQSSASGTDTIVLPSTTDNTAKLAEKVLESTINIPPLIYQNQGGIVGIYVARDVDFSSVYELKPVQR